MVGEKIAGTQVIARTFQILRCFDTHHQTLSLAELVKLTGLRPPTAHRILQALVNEGILVQDSDTARYRPGYWLVKLGDLARQGNDLIRVSQRHLAELHKKWGEAIVIDVPDKDLKMVSVLIIPSTYRLGTSENYDAPTYPHCTAAGKVVLAHLPVGELDEFLKRDLPQMTANTITDREMLRKELARVRERGYSTNIEEQELGLVAIGAPIRNAKGKVVASLSIGGPSARMARENYARIIESTVQTAMAISAELGYDGK